jgi:acetyltransferase-like isoleucine patch superfamily enzyme
MRKPFEFYEPIVILKPENVEIHHTARIDSFVKIEGGNGVRIGKYVHIASFVHVNVGGGEVIFEDGSCAASGSRIIGGSNLIEGISCSATAPKEQQIIKRMKTVIGKNAIIFSNAVILPGVTIGESAVIAAGAVVTKDVEPFAVMMGMPARKVGVRNVTIPSEVI